MCDFTNTTTNNSLDSFLNDSNVPHKRKPRAILSRNAFVFLAVLQNISLSACFSAENEWLRRSFSVPRCENWQSPRAPFVSDPTRSIPNHPHTTHAERPFVSSGGLWEWVPYTLARVKTLNYRKLNGHLALSALAFSTLRASVSTYFISLPCCWSESNFDRKTKTEKMKKAKYRYHKGLSKNCNTDS